MTRDLFVTGTDTGVGKTVLSALLVASLNRRYWKPIQTGASEGRDRAAVVNWAGVTIEHTHPEAFLFDPPVSPHLLWSLERFFCRQRCRGAFLLLTGNFNSPASDFLIIHQQLMLLSLPGSMPRASVRPWELSPTSG